MKYLLYLAVAIAVVSPVCGCSEDEEAGAGSQDAAVDASAETGVDGTTGSNDGGADEDGNGNGNIEKDAGATSSCPDRSGDVVNPGPSLDERCPEAQTGNYLLVLYPDRVDAYRQRDYSASYECEVFALAAHGITNAVGMVRGVDGNFYVMEGGETCGEIFAFDPDGIFIGRVTANVNLAGAGGIWNTFGDDFIAWSGANSNLYKINADGSFGGSYVPPAWRGGSRVTNVTDVLFVAQDRVVMTFSDRPAKVFADPWAPDFSEEEVGPGNAVTGIDTDEGFKILMSAQLGGPGNGYGVLLYKPAGGRYAPEMERIMLDATQIVDGIDLLVLRENVGFMVLDSSLGGSPRVSVFDVRGDHQGEVELANPGEPTQIMLERIFPNL